MSTTRRTVRSLAIGAIALGFFLAVIATVLGSLFLVRERPGARSFDDALDDFRSSRSNQSDGSVAAVNRPPSGVYLADAAGKMSISFPPTAQNYGATAPVTIRYDGENCWSTTVDFNSAFQQQWDYCITEDIFTEVRNRTTTRWDLGAMAITNTAIFECSPPGEILRATTRTGDRTTHECIGHSDEISGTTVSTVTFEALGPETVTIGDRSVSTHRLRETDVLTGPQRGTTVIDYWYATSDMLLIKMERHVDIRTDSPVGDITYKEDGGWTLSSLDPTR